MKVYTVKYENVRGYVHTVVALVSNDQDRNDAIQQVWVSDPEYDHLVSCKQESSNQVLLLR